MVIWSPLCGHQKKLVLKFFNKKNLKCFQDFHLRGRFVLQVTQL